MSFCLIPQQAEKFTQALVSGKIDPAKLSQMPSEERRKFLAQFVGEFNAKGVNTLFESKLLLKNQQRGMITWAKNVRNLSPRTRKDIIAKINKLEKAIDVDSEDQFLKDIVEQRLGVSVSHHEAKHIMKMTDKIDDLFDETKALTEQSKAYHAARQQLYKYVRETSTKAPFVGSKKAIAGRIAAEAVSTQRALKTGFDLSASLRQGRAYLGTREWNGAFRRMFKYAKDEANLDALEVDMLAHKYSDDAIKYKKELGLTMLGEKFTQREEEFAAKFIEKIPLLRGSERAFVGFLNDLRFHRFVNTIAKQEAKGNPMTPEAKKQLAEVIGASTGRGTLNITDKVSFERAAGELATVMFSPRWFASRLKMLANPFTKKGVARTEAIKGLANTAGQSVALLSMLAAAGVDVEVDPRSSDFGKVRAGNTRFDITGGLAPYITLLSRVATKSTKSSTDDTIRFLNTGQFGGQTRTDVVTSFIANKASPMAAIIRDFMKGETFEGEELDINFDDLSENKDEVAYLAEQIFLPLIGTTAWDAFKDGAGIGVGGVLAEMFGVGVNTYPPLPHQEALMAYQAGDDQLADEILKEGLATGDISESQSRRILRNKDLPTSLAYFQDLSDDAQINILKRMGLDDLSVYAWYANEDVRKNFGSISKDTAEWLEQYRAGRVTRPKYKRGELINE